MHSDLVIHLAAARDADAARYAGVRRQHPFRRYWFRGDTGEQQPARRPRRRAGGASGRFVGRGRGAPVARLRGG
jgi:hypothetical protein